MSVSRLSAMMIQANDVVFIDTPERSECWICHEPGVPHALVLSCSLDRRADMERAVAEIRQADLTATTEPTP
jgi:hypothetical protein